MNTTLKTIAATAVMAVGIGGVAESASATTTAAPYVGALCAVYGNDYLHSQPSVSSPIVGSVSAGEDFRVVAVSAYWVYGHSTYSYPTDGWFLSKHISC